MPYTPQHKQETRERILRSARKLFNRKGFAEVTIDDKEVGIVDQFGPGRDLPFDWSHTGLKPGKHTIRLKVLEHKNPKSKGRFVNISGFYVLAGAD